MLVGLLVARLWVVVLVDLEFRIVLAGVLL